MLLRRAVVLAVRVVVVMMRVVVVMTVVPMRPVVVLVTMMPVGPVVVMMVPVRPMVVVVVVSVVCHGRYSRVREGLQGVSGQSMTSAPSSTATCTVGWSSQTPGEVALCPVSMSKPTS